MTDLSRQYYNKIAKKFSNINNVGTRSNRDNRKVFYGLIDFVKSGMKLLDLGCGDGLDLVHYKSLEANVFGLDASEEFLKIAKNRLPDQDIRLGSFEKTSFENGFFDIVLSKYAIQIVPNLEPVFKEVFRILKPGGIFMYLVTHPIRSYFEKKEKTGDYFKQKVFHSRILNNALVVEEPSHTMNEYLNKEFLEKFDVQFFGEYWDPSAERIGGKKYPGYFILTAKKREVSDIASLT